jgi:hypothetical protein
MDFLQKFSIEELKNVIDRMPEESKSKAEARRRSNDVLRLHRDGLLDVISTFSSTVERIGKHYRSSATSARQTLGRVWTLVKYTYLRADKPVPLPGGVDKQAVESAVEAFWLWNRQERAKKTHREKGEFSVQEEKAVSDIQFREIMETVLQKYRDDVEPLYGNPNAESRIVIQRYLLLFYLLMEPNVRLTPLVNLKYFGNSLRDNIICFEFLKNSMELHRTPTSILELHPVSYLHRLQANMRAIDAKHGSMKAGRHRECLPTYTKLKRYKKVLSLS